MLPFLHASRRRAAPLLSAVCLLAACRDSSVAVGPTAPPEVTVAPCNTTDCNTFRSLSVAGSGTLVRAASGLTSSLRDTETAARLQSRLGSLQSLVSTGKTDEARLTLIGILATIDAATNDPARRADLPDLAAMRLNLEPLIFKLGLR